MKFTFGFVHEFRSPIYFGLGVMGVTEAVRDISLDNKVHLWNLCEYARERL